MHRTVRFRNETYSRPCAAIMPSQTEIAAISFHGLKCSTPLLRYPVHPAARSIIPRSNSSIPEIDFRGFGTFPLLIHRFSVVRPIPSLECVDSP
ncbi:MAG: hypothetical protein WBF17_25180 [Phycisphaerae bacterium]